jgi:hypothetical protein
LIAVFNLPRFLSQSDEAHRTQYGFKAKTIDDKDEQGNVVGKKVVYGFAKYMRDALQVEIFEWWKKLPRQRQPVIILLVDRGFQPA